jgi:hypothetical protein
MEGIEASHDRAPRPYKCTPSPKAGCTSANTQSERPCRPRFAYNIRYNGRMFATER